MKDKKEKPPKGGKKKGELSFSAPQAKLDERKEDFYRTLAPFASVYGKEMVRAFFDYWTEPNKSHSRMRFELEKTWDVERRLGTWASKENQFSNGTNRQNNSTAATRAADAAAIIARLAAEDDARR